MISPQVAFSGPLDHIMSGALKALLKAKISATPTDVPVCRIWSAIAPSRASASSSSRATPASSHSVHSEGRRERPSRQMPAHGPTSSFRPEKRRCAPPGRTLLSASIGTRSIIRRPNAPANDAAISTTKDLRRIPCAARRRGVPTTSNVGPISRTNRGRAACHFSRAASDRSPPGAGPILIRD